jgi:nucleoside-diphosphate kinase
MTSYAQTLILLKPDALRRRLVGRILHRFEDDGFDIENIKRFPEVVDDYEAKLKDHYAEHEGKPFFNRLIATMRLDPLIAVILRGEGDIITKSRNMIGATSVVDAAPGTIRGDFGVPGRPPSENLVHASDSAEAAKREIHIWFETGYLEKP